MITLFVGVGVGVDRKGGLVGDEMDAATGNAFAQLLSLISGLREGCTNIIYLHLLYE